MEEKIIYDVSTVLATMKVYEDYCVLTAKKNFGTLFLTKKFFSGEKSSILPF